MYAVFEDGSRQYRVSEGDVLLLDYRDVPKGERLFFDRVLLYQNGDDVQIGRPTLPGFRVLTEVIRRPTDEDKQPSIKYYIQHFRKRKNSRRLKGHRQFFVEVQVRSILQPGMEPPPPAPPKPAEAPASTPSPAPAPAAT